MKSPTLLFSVFVLVALVQLYVPAKMILDREDVMISGKEYKFKTAPIDPNDPFRGKYITLRYEENMIEIHGETDWSTRETIYLQFTADSAGFARIRDFSKEPPDDNDYLEAKVSTVIKDGPLTQLYINYPFDRYYMEETKAQPAEQTYQESRQDSTQVAYALVSIKNGEAVLKDVMIDGMSIKEIVENGWDE